MDDETKMNDTSYPTIIISDEVREYLDKILHAQGEASNQVGEDENPF